MKLRYTIIISLLLVSNLTIFTQEHYTAKDKNIILQIVKDAYRGYEERNIERFMSLWSKKSPDYNKLRNNLMQNFKEIEDIKITFDKKPPKITFKKSEATVAIQNEFSAKYVVMYPYLEKGDKIYFVWKKDRDKKWKIVKVKMIKEKKKKKDKAKRQKKIQQKFKTKDEEEIAKLSKDAISCLSKKDINCFLKYNNCSFPFGYIRCNIIKIILKIMKSETREEQIRIDVDKDKMINISHKENKIISIVNIETKGKYKILAPFEKRQTTVATLKKENGNWKIWKVENIEGEHKK